MNCIADTCMSHACPGQLAAFVVVALLELIPKGFALWRAAKSHQKGWFIALLFLNTAGLLPLLYLFVFNKKKKLD